MNCCAKGKPCDLRFCIDLPARCFVLRIILTGSLLGQSGLGTWLGAHGSWHEGSTRAIQDFYVGFGDGLHGGDRLTQSECRLFRVRRITR